MPALLIRERVDPDPHRSQLQRRDLKVDLGHDDIRAHPARPHGHTPHFGANIALTTSPLLLILPPSEAIPYQTNEIPLTAFRAAGEGENRGASHSL